jgi:hypothetical protein
MWLSLEILNYSVGVSGVGVTHRRVCNVQDYEKFTNISFDLCPIGPRLYMNHNDFVIH